MTDADAREREPSLPRVAVLVATKNRANELANRALRAIALQTYAPDYLVVVDDSDRRHRDDNRRIVRHVALPRTRIEYRENDRTPGASGAWNVGLDWLRRETDDASALYVAILDDDDSWEPTYLEACLRAVTVQQLDMVAADLVRHETMADGGATLHAPEQLDARVFLTRNPHIQGSNLFVRLETLLASGTFDEGLPSTTDRDLCIRVADLGTVRYARLPLPLVHHHADPGRPRLSSPGSDTKLAGLDGFWRKYRGRMTAREEREFEERARRLFGWQRPSEWVFAAEVTAIARDEGARLALVVGVITSADRASVERLVRSLATLTDDHRLVGLDLVLLENGSSADAGLRHVADSARSRGIDCFVVPLAQQIADAEAGRFGAAFGRGAERASIAVARTMLQTYLYELARRRPGAVVWILDEDMLLETLTWRAGCGVESEPLAIVDALVRLRASKIDVAIGTVTDAPPLPFASCVRTQLVDAYHNLEWMAALEPGAALPDRAAENMEQRARCEDYYYDLSRRETDHLESPFWYVPAVRDATSQAALIEMLGRLARILAGEQVFRPLVVDGSVDPSTRAKPSVHRGGNTFVFDTEALRDFSNGVPAIDGQSTRRSDMVWSLLNLYVAGRAVVKVPLAVRQDRRHERPGALDLDKLCRDIQGFALYSALEALFLEKLEARSGPVGTAVDMTRLSEDDGELAVRKFRKYLRERTAAFVLSFHRAAGIARSLARYTDPANAARYWWLRDRACDGAVASLRAFVLVLQREYDLSRLRPFRAQVENVSDDLVREYLTTLQQDMTVRRVATAPRSAAWIDEQRVDNARAWLAREGAPTPLRHLGSGSEAVVFTDGATVFKYIDYWKTRDHDEQLEFLQSQVGRWRGLRSLSPLSAVRCAGSRVVITYPYEASLPYGGEHGAGLIELLRDCRRAGIVCSNVHPDNLVLVDGRVKLIDYGSDTRAYTDEGFRRMARRAFLTFRHAEHPELKALMRRSIDDETLPELDGFDRFWAAIEPPSKEVLVDVRLAAIVRENAHRRILDYGCGRARLAVDLARIGASVVAYDPDETLRDEWRRRGADGVRFVTAAELRDLRADPFDVVVCSLVLCTVHEAEARDALREIRAVVRDGAQVLVVVCNPRFVGTQTALQQRMLPAGWHPDDSFEYTKLVHSSGRCRTEVHRSVSSYERLLADAGLVVDDAEETPGIDVADFGYASDFLILRCHATGAESA